MTHKLLPAEPTEEMKDAYFNLCRERFHAPSPSEIWKAMYAAAPDHGLVLVSREDIKAVIAGISGNPAYPHANALRDRLTAALGEQS